MGLVTRPSTFTRILLFALVLQGWVFPTQLSHGQSQFHSGHDPRIEKLLHSLTRPTVAQLVRELRPWPKRNPFYHQDANRYQILHAGLHAVIPELIASMEIAYPGATWAPLGRDVAQLGDVIDAFYHSIGQLERVRRINASTSTFQGLVGEEGRRRLVALLEATGLNLDDPAGSHPLIIFDRTSYGPDSQSTRLIEAGYSEYVRRGGHPADLIRHFNLLTFERNGGFGAWGGQGDSGQSTLNARTDLDAFFLRQEFYSSLEQKPRDVLSMEAMESDTASVLSYTAEWHGTFGELARFRDGRIEGLAGPLSDISTREEILSDLYDIIDIVSRPEFLKAVREQARGIGYVFPQKRPSGPDSIEKIRTRASPRTEYRRQLAKLINGLTPLDQDPWGNANLPRATAWWGGPQVQVDEKKSSEEISANAKQLADWMLEQSGGAALEDRPIIFLQGILEARSKKLISKRGLRRLTSLALAVSDSESEFWLRAMRGLIRESDALFELLDSEARFFAGSSHWRADQVNAAYEKLVVGALDPARCESGLTGRKR